MGATSAASWTGPVAWAALAGVLYGLAHPPTPPPWGPALGWLAPVPLYLALRNRGPAAAAALAGLFGMLATAVVVRWIVPTLNGHFEWSLAASIGFLGLLALLSAAPFCALAFGAVRIGRATPLSPAGFAAAFVASEWLRAQVGLRSPWAFLGATQIDAERIRQLADLSGVYGVSALVAGVAASGAASLLRVLDARPGARSGVPALVPALAAAALLLATLGYGEIRLRSLEATTAAATDVLEVALVQGNLDSDLRWRRSHASRVLRRYGGLTRDALYAADSPTPDLVIWPENAVQTALDDPVYGSTLRAFARHAPLLLGAPRHDRDRDGQRRSFNSAHLVLPDGHVATYDKRRLLPFSEVRPFGARIAIEERGDLDRGVWMAGSVPGVLPLAGTRLGVLICLESLYPELAREVVAEGAEVLVNPSNDAWLAGEGARAQHFAQSAFRAIETRRPLLRVTPTGITAVVSPAGAVLSRLPERTEGVLRARLPRAPLPPSLYAQTGDVFAIGCVLACTAPGLAALGRSRQASGPRSSATHS